MELRKLQAERPELGQLVPAPGPGKGGKAGAVELTETETDRLLLGSALP